jgi:hypothetical protein
MALLVGAILDIISIGLTATSIGQTAINGAQESTVSGTYRYRMRIGQNVNTGDADGWAPEVKLYNSDWGELARSSFESRWANDGELHDEQFGSGTRQIHHADMIAGNNAICVAWWEFYDADNTPPVVLLGGNVLRCGGYWSPTNSYLLYEDNSPTPELDCVWLNRGYNGCHGQSNDNTIFGFMMNNYYPYWLGVRSYESDVNGICDNLVTYGSGDCRKRDMEEARDVPEDEFTELAKEVIVTDRDIARVYCEHDRSRGRSILSMKERLFCDMRTRELRPLCEDIQTEGCYNFVIPNSKSRRSDFKAATSSGRDSELKVSRVSIDAQHAAAKRSLDVEQRSSISVAYGDCISADGKDSVLNESHYFGPVTAGIETIYSTITGGIYLQTQNGTSVIVPQCSLD